MPSPILTRPDRLAESVRGTALRRSDDATDGPAAGAIADADALEDAYGAEDEEDDALGNEAGGGDDAMAPSRGDVGGEATVSGLLGARVSSRLSSRTQKKKKKNGCDTRRPSWRRSCRGA